MDEYEIIEVDGETLKIWPPLDDTYTGLTGYAISDEGGWLDGLYDSRDSAIMGFKLCQQDGGYQQLAEMTRRICWHNNENRLITVADFNAKT